MNPMQDIAQDGEEEDENRHYVLRLFIAGASVNSRHAVANLTAVCESYLGGRYSLDIIDVYQQKEMAELEQIIALPLLVKSQPLPERKLIGDMSDTKKVLKGLGIIP
jgi:circadian clock protein KaiB